MELKALHGESTSPSDLTKCSTKLVEQNRNMLVCYFVSSDHLEWITMTHICTIWRASGIILNVAWRQTVEKKFKCFPSCWLVTRWGSEGTMGYIWTNCTSNTWCCVFLFAMLVQLLNSTCVNDSTRQWVTGLCESTLCKPRPRLWTCVARDTTCAPFWLWHCVHLPTVLST